MSCVTFHCLNLIRPNGEQKLGSQGPAPITRPLLILEGTSLGRHGTRVQDPLFFLRPVQKTDFVDLPRRNASITVGDLNNRLVRYSGHEN